LNFNFIFYLLRIKEAFMRKNAVKISILAWFAILLFVFSCESEAEKERARIEREKEIAKEDSVHGYRLVGDISINKRERDSIRAQIAQEDSIRGYRKNSARGYRLVGDIPINNRERDSVHAQIAQEDSIRDHRLVGADIPINKRERDSLYRHIDSIDAARDSFWKDKEFELPSSPDFETVLNFCRTNFPDADGCYNEINMRFAEKYGFQVKRMRARAK
jgi:hypothetical protein